MKMRPLLTATIFLSALLTSVNQPASAAFVEGTTTNQQKISLAISQWGPRMTHLTGLINAIVTGAGACTVDSE